MSTVCSPSAHPWPGPALLAVEPIGGFQCIYGIAYLHSKSPFTVYTALFSASILSTRVFFFSLNLFSFIESKSVTVFLAQLVPSTLDTLLFDLPCALYHTCDSTSVSSTGEYTHILSQD
jgi:hypothetical protein